MSHGKKKKRKFPPLKNRIVLWILLVVVITACTLVLRMRKQDVIIKSEGSVSNIQTPDNREADYLGKASPQFEKDQIKINRQEAEQARNEGRSNIVDLNNGVINANPEADIRKMMERANRFKKTEAPPAPKKEPEQIDLPAPTPPRHSRTTPQRTYNNVKQSRPDEERSQQLAGILRAQLDEFDQQMMFRKFTPQSYKTTQEIASAVTGRQTQRLDSTAQSPPQTASFNMQKELGIKPGTVFYASNKQTLNTDAPAPVATVKLLSGPLVGSTCIGTFSLLGDGIAFVFKELQTKDGDKYTMTGFAVDPATKSYTVASEVDYHRLERWGGLIASSFLKGYAEAVEASGTSTTSNVGSGLITSESPEYSLSERFWIASGEVASALSEVAKANFTRNATAWLHSDFPIGVLIINLEPIN
tara:strand:+ start:1999 stop:3246 length:1248 start_codon:yes stop_codon:yes gene_type:complete